MKIYAHRGASSDFPEMTRAAFEGAITQGADGFECDLRLTSDNVVVAWHDADLMRCAGSSLKIATSTYEQLRAAYPIMTLGEILALAMAHKKGLALETKHPVPTSGAIEREVVKILNEKKLEISESGIDIALMSFSWQAVRRARRMGFSAVYLSAHSSSYQLLRFFNRFRFHESLGRRPHSKSGALSYGPSMSAFRKFAAHRTRIFVWTVDEIADAQLCLERGVDVLITNKPGLIRRSLEDSSGHI